MDQPGKVANPARGQLNRDNEHYPCPRSRLRIWSRKTGSAVPSRVSLLNLHINQAESGAYSQESHRFLRRRLFILFQLRHTSSGQSRVYRVPQQLRTDDVHCRESAGTGPVVLKVVEYQVNLTATGLTQMSERDSPRHTAYNIIWLLINEEMWYYYLLRDASFYF